MTARALTPLFALLLACGADEDAPLTVSDVTVFAPLPGQTTAVAYFTLANNSAGAITLREVSSQDFADVAMHATVADDGIAEMLPLDAITIAEGGELAFSVGESHLMLMEPREIPEPGNVVTLEFHYEAPGMDGDRTTTVTAPMLERGAQ